MTAHGPDSRGDAVTAAEKNDVSAKRSSGSRNVLPSAHPLHSEAMDFLVEEAETLDAGDLDAWLDMLTPDIKYRMPLRVTTNAIDGDGFIGSAAHFDEDLATLKLRVRKLQAPSSSVEYPPSRVRRIVTNVRVRPRGCAEGSLDVRSYLLVWRSRWDSPDWELMLAERCDTLRRVGSRWLLAKRDILVQQSTPGTINLAIFFL